MHETLPWQEQYAALAQDVRAEVLYHLLGANEKGKDTIVFYANGGFKRVLRYDVEKIHPPGHRKFQNKSHVIEINRKGLYDQFPEFLFHYSKSGKPFKNIEELKDEHAHHQKLQEDARKFFWPVDDQFVKLRSYILSFELRMGQSGTYASKDYLKRFWNIPDFFDSNQSRLLTVILPMARDISVNLEWMQQAFKAVLRMNVQIEKSLIPFIHHFKGRALALNYSQLGIDSILGDTLSEIKYGISIKLGPIDMEVANEIGTSGKRALQFEYLCEHLVPLDLAISTAVVPTPDFSLILQKDRDVCSILGVSSILSD
jgi:hypothetical protein